MKKSDNDYEKTSEILLKYPVFPLTKRENQVIQI